MMDKGRRGGAARSAQLLVPVVVVVMLAAAWLWKRNSSGVGQDGGTPFAAHAAASARQKLEALRARFGSTLLPSRAVAGEPGAVREPASVTLASDAKAPFRLEDGDSSLAIDVRLLDARSAPKEPVDGYAVYRDAVGAGTTMIQRVLPNGVEDYVSFEVAPAEPSLAYELKLPKAVAGLRLVANTLEFLDEQGAPRLRVSSPFVVSADGTHTEARLSIERCVADEDPASPWGRSVTAPGGEACTVRVAWPAERVTYPALVDPGWTTTGSMSTPRQGHTATMLTTGKVLVAGGSNGTTALASAELYDPVTRTWAATGAMTGARQLHTAVQLATSSNATTSGKVLIAGGINGTSSLATAQLYSPTAGTWIAAGNLNSARHAHMATRLADGRVLITGGSSGTTTLATAALYNPASGAGSWAATTGPLPPTGQRAHSATLLSTSNGQLNNKVLLAGGNSGTATLSAVYLFDPAQSAFSTLASMPAAREGHTATVLANGKLLVAGGKSGSTTLATAALFDPGSGPGSWSTVGNMTTVRQGHTATLLPDGRVLVAGGKNATTTLSSAELFTPSSNTWAATGAMRAPVQNQTATLLPSGMILVAGGVNGTTTVSAAELYDVTQGNACTATSQCLSGFCVSGVCCNISCTDQCSSCNVAGSAGLCSPKANGSSCSDGNGCTLSDTCQSGSCTAGAPKACTALDACHVAGTCDASTGTCSNPVGPDKIGCNINLRVDGVVDNGDGTYFAIFGHDSSATTTFHPASNQVSVNGVPVSVPSVVPPAYLPPGQHPGDYLPTFNAGQTIAWTVDGQTVSASQASPLLTKIPIGSSGYKVVIAGMDIVLRADLGPYLTIPPAPGDAPDPTAGLSDFAGTLEGALTVSASGAATYKVPIALAPGLAGMAPNLALAYSSQTGPALAGQGFELTGLSMIHRCAFTAGEDGFAQPVSMTGPAPGNDALCLDGKRLFDRGARSDGAERFELEFEDFSEISMAPAPDAASADDKTITIVTKSGQRRYYGLTYATRVSLPGLWADSPSGQGRTTGIWLLEKVVDVWGNYWDAVYNDASGNTGVAGSGNTLKTDFETRGILPTEIHYTGRLAGSSGGSDEAVEPFQTVHFGYELRPDVRAGRLRSGVLPRTRRLTTIDTGIGVYTLDYIQPSSPPTADDKMLPSRLQTIHYCPTASPCVQPLSFDWDGGGYGWEATSAYKLPVDIKWSGARFVDLDGDGRLDILQVKTNDVDDSGDDPDVTTGAWRNTGSGFVAAPGGWRPPADLGAVPHDQSPDNTAFADLDGDGLPDGIHMAIIGEQPHCPSTISQCTSNAFIELNRLRTSGTWSFVIGTEFPSSADWANFVVFGSNGALVDINNDGRADIVALGAAGNEMKVLLNAGFDGSNVLWQPAPNIYGGVTDIHDYELQDVNRDGFPDLVAKYTSPVAGKVYLQTGAVTGGHGSVWVNADQLTFPGNYPHSMQAAADFDGDGLYDVLQYGCRTGVDPPPIPVFPQCEVELPPNSPIYVNFVEAIGFSNGAGYDMLPSADARLAVLAGFTPPTNDYNIKLEDYAFVPVDLNADGLADLVQRKLAPGGYSDPAPGRLLVNTGSSFTTLNGATSWQDPVESSAVPRVPRQNRMTGDDNLTFIDLDGDGVTDLASPSTSWRNTFRPAVIKAFPNGLASKTIPTYKTITMADALTNTAFPDHATYAETDSPTAASSVLRTPLRVVASLVSDDGIGGTLETDYEYRDLRNSPTGRGPQGFRTVLAIGPDDLSNGTRTQTETEYFQAYPYTGLPSHVRRTLVDAATLQKIQTLSAVSTEYCDAIPGSGVDCTGYFTDASLIGFGKKRFLRPTYVVDDSFLVSTSDLASRTTASQTLRIVSDFQHDQYGNATRTSVKTEQGDESYQKTVVNTYGTPGSEEERLGKVTYSQVTTQKLAPADCLATPTVHNTEFKYGHVGQFASPANEGVTIATLGLQETIVEPSGGGPTELRTAYEYDRFGNVIKTTNCIGASASCEPGATGSDPLDRVSRVSYDPADFAATTGLFTPLYGAGRYPVKTTNAAGHVEFTVYDTRSGKLLQRTDPNGVTTCLEYDGLGRQTFNMERCGTAPLITQIKYLSTADAATGPLKVVTARLPPVGSPTWTYADRLGRPTMTLTRGFDSQYVKSLTLYDNLGRVSRTTKPYLTSVPDFMLEDQARVRFTRYDAIGRVVSATDDLGVLDGTAASASSVTALTTTTYDGASITTRRRANGEVRARTETKNALGKLASVTDANGVTLSFSYDADGNLTDTASPADVCNPPPGAAGKVLHNTYDGRGRKQTSHDPDLGDWSYQYDGFGDLRVQTDAKGQLTTMSYDALGRMLQRSDPSGTAQWIYDAAPHGVGKLAAMVSPSDSRLAGSCTLEFAPAPAPGQNQAGRSFHYTEFGEVEEVTDCADGSEFVTTHGYDYYGRPNVLRYPEVKGQRFAVQYAYTHAGYLRYVADDADGSLIWAVRAMNAAGQVTDEVLRNGVETTSVRNDATGWLLSRTSTAHADFDTTIQDYAYAFDEAGNLRTRQRSDAVVGADSSETFGYDLLDRLTNSDVQIPSQTYDAPESYSYDALGNLQTKAGKAYKYDTGCLAGSRAAGPHALCQIDSGPIYAYDANGNLTSVGDRAVTWNASNKPTRLSNGSGSGAQTADFIYGADGQRVVQAIGTGDGELGSGTNHTVARTVYVGLDATGKSIYERTTRGSTVEHAHFIYAGSVHDGSAFALRVVTEDASSSAQRTDYEYHHFDHLGSLTAVSDAQGHVTSPAWGGPAATIYGYDAWGARRSPDGRPADATTLGSATGNRGFTDQEEIPTLGLVNMNGRIYDPVAGRFLSPDPNVQTISDLQSYNRYSYASNNPLKYSDPTGYYNYWQNGLSGFVDFTLGIGGGVVCIATGGTACPIVVAIASTVVSTTAAIASGSSWDSVIGTTATGLAIGALSSGLGDAVGGLVEGTDGLGDIVSGAVGRGISGALMTTLSGGDLGENIVSGAVEGALEAMLALGVQRERALSQADVAKKKAASGSTGTLAEGTPVFCGQGGAPDCGKLADRTPTQRSFDDYARFFPIQTSPRNGSLTVGEATSRYNNEHWEVVIRRANGTFDASVIHLGGDNHDIIKVNIPGLKQGETAVFIHSHFGGVGAEQISDIDVDFGRTWGFPVYAVGPRPGYQIHVYENSLHTITEIPSW